MDEGNAFRGFLHLAPTCDWPVLRNGPFRLPECSYGARAEQVVERWREFGAHRSVWVHKDAYEERLVEELLDVVRRSRVSGTARLGEVEREAQVGLDALVMFGAPAELLRGVAQAWGDAVLLAFEEVQWDGSGVVNVGSGPAS